MILPITFFLRTVLHEGYRIQVLSIFQVAWANSKEMGLSLKGSVTPLADDKDHPQHWFTFQIKYNYIKPKRL